MKFKNILTSLLIAGILIPQVSIGMEGASSNFGVHFEDIDLMVSRDISYPLEIPQRVVLNVSTIIKNDYENDETQNPNASQGSSCERGDSLMKLKEPTESPLETTKVGVSLFGGDAHPLIEVAGHPKGFVFAGREPSPYGERVAEEDIRIKNSLLQGHNFGLCSWSFISRRIDIGLVVLSDHLRKGGRNILFAFTGTKGGLLDLGEFDLLEALKGRKSYDIGNNFVNFSLIEDVFSIEYTENIERNRNRKVTISMGFKPFGELQKDINTNPIIVPEAAPQKLTRAEVDALEDLNRDSSYFLASND